MTYIAASVKTLTSELSISDDDAHKIRAIWKADDIEALEDIDSELFNAVSKGMACGYSMSENTGQTEYRKKLMIDRVFETHGIETLGRLKRGGEYVDYCNIGDSYMATIVFIDCRLVVQSWAHYAENNLINQGSDY